VKTRGFSLLELTVVLCVIAILFAGSAIQYQKRIDDSRREVLRHQSQTFQRMVENIRAISVLQRSHVVDLGTGVFVGVNQHGWAVSAGINRDISHKGASKNSCRSLWLYLFSGSSTKNDKSGTKLPEDFDISLIENYICRYNSFKNRKIRISLTMM